MGMLKAARLKPAQKAPEKITSGISIHKKPFRGKSQISGTSAMANDVITITGLHPNLSIRTPHGLLRAMATSAAIHE